MVAQKSAERIKWTLSIPLTDKKTEMSEVDCDLPSKATE